jgi:hypothetical protein
MDRRLQDSPSNDLESVEICRRTDDIPFPTRDDMLNSMIKGTKIRNSEKDTLYLSPLPECIDHLPSSLKSFIALPEVEYDFEKTKDTEQTSNRQTVSLGPEHTPSNEAPPTPLEYHSRTHAFPVRSSTEPISANPHAPKVSSGLSLTAPRDPSIYDQDTRVSSRESSRRSSRHSSPSPFKPSPQTRSSVPIPDTYSRDRGRSFVLPQNGPEQLRSQLQDLLSNPVSSSLPNISHFPSSNVHGSPPESRSSSSTSPRPLPPPHHSSTFPPLVTSTPPIPPPHRSSSALTIQRPVISHASSAALALEKERQKAEKERREREAAEYERHKAEQQQRQLSATPSFNSLRDPAYFPTVQSSTTTRREPSGYGGGSGVTSNAGSLSRGNPSSLRESTGYATQHHRHQVPGNGKGRLASVQTLFT